MKKFKLIVFSTLLFSPLFGFCQDGTLDTSFGNNGLVVTDFLGAGDQSYSILEQNDGKIVSFGFANNGDITILSRYNPNGDLDPSFGNNGKVINDFGNIPGFVFYTSVHQQNDGKIITTSEDLDPNGDLDIFLVRYLENGDLDNTYGTGGTIRLDYGEDKLASSLLLPDGKVLVGGTTTIGESRYILLAKYLENGSLDLSFGNNGMVINYINDEPTWSFPLILQPDGKVLMAYRKQEANNLRTLMFQRFLENGELDPSFGVAGVVTTNITASHIHGSIALKENGNIMAVIRLAPGNQDNPILAQFLSNGELDLSFGVQGRKNIPVLSIVPLNIILDQNENILISGNDYSFEIRNYFLTRFNSDGDLDPTFGVSGRTELEFESHGIIMQADNKILVTGYSFWYEAGDVDFKIFRLNNGILGISANTLQDLNVYPNPSEGVFTIKNSSSFDSETKYFVTDLSGKIIQKGVLKTMETTINLSEAQAGIYFLKTSGTTLKLLKN